MPAQANLQRFLDAQRADYPTAYAEIKAGRKRSHATFARFSDGALAGRDRSRAPPPFEVVIPFQNIQYEPKVVV